MEVGKNFIGKLPKRILLQKELLQMPQACENSYRQPMDGVMHEVQESQVGEGGETSHRQFADPVVSQV